MTHFYNDIDAHANAWLSGIIANGHLPNGDIDERSISEIASENLKQYRQCHFFSGIGGWPLALKLANWPDDVPVWTGSCPCQPYSQAGKKLGNNDKRHLWPYFFRLIKACRPPVIMGEQVAGKLGYAWFDGIATDLEGEGYACRAVDIPACAVNAPHIRQRIYWIAMANTDRERLKERFGKKSEKQKQLCPEHPHGLWNEWIPVTSALDGKTRRAEPTIPMLAPRIPGRVALMRGYGNAIVPPLAAEVIRAFMESVDETHARTC